MSQVVVNRWLVAVAVGVSALAIVIWWFPRRMPKFAVQGHITLDNKPLDNAVIQFIPLPPTVSKQTGAEIIAGKYTIDEIDGLPPGKYRVEIHPYLSPFQPSSRQTTGISNGTAAVNLPRIPTWYNTKSILQVTAFAESNRFDFSLSVRTPQLEQSN